MNEATPTNEVQDGVVEGEVVTPEAPPWHLSMRSEYFLHITFLVIASGIILMSFLMRSVGQYSVFLPWASVPMPDTCASRVMFGTDCPSCGMTRAFISISHGQFSKALAFNPACFPVYIFVAGQIPWRIYQLVRLHSGRMPFFSPWLFAVPVVVLLCLITQWIIRNWLI